MPCGQCTGWAFVGAGIDPALQTGKDCEQELCGGVVFGELVEAMGLHGGGRDACC
jgi:hypothetical protein